ncbi:hypothetical protein ZWY2020_019520 [Hordeum vulgare]|nr:hypothetical protein ZWY2020_019520 [Hordeum vulgare]
MLQQLLSSCPRLADLTLEECASVKELAVTSPWVRRFVMICCHNATGVELHTTLAQVAALQRRPSSRSSFSIVTNYETATAVRIEMCRGIYCKESLEVAPVITLISRCEKLGRLDLCLRLSVAFLISGSAQQAETTRRMREEAG